MNELDSVGYLRISNETDRATVATILFRNGYTVSPVRQKRNGKTYEYYVKFTKISLDMPEQVVTKSES